jgi:3-oxoacyl-[acyl-carrier-protein] synthase-1
MSISVTGIGLACPLGLQAAAACAAIRAKLNRREVLPFRDSDGDELAGSRLDRIPAHVPRRSRALALACYALDDMLGERMAEILPRVRLLIAVSDPERRTPRGVEQLCRDLSEQLELVLAPNMLEVFVGGASAGLRALAAAREHIESQRVSACIVLAADSLVDASALSLYSQRRRLLTERNPDGFTPGEAAACLFLQPTTSRSWGSVIGIGQGHEEATLDSDVPLRANGLRYACGGALAEAKLAAHEIDFRISDAAGESYHFKEQALLVARLLRQSKPEFPLWLPAAQLGHVGAAAGICSVVVALTAMHRRYAPGPRVLICAGSDDGERMAAVLRAP